MAKIYDLNFYREFQLIITWQKKYYSNEKLLDQMLMKAYKDEYED